MWIDMHNLNAFFILLSIFVISKWIVNEIYKWYAVEMLVYFVDIKHNYN